MGCGLWKLKEIEMWVSSKSGLNLWGTWDWIHGEVEISSNDKIRERIIEWITWMMWAQGNYLKWSGQLTSIPGCNGGYFYHINVPQELCLEKYWGIERWLQGQACLLCEHKEPISDLGSYVKKLVWAAVVTWIRPGQDWSSQHTNEDGEGAQYALILRSYW